MLESAILLPHVSWWRQNAASSRNLLLTGDDHCTRLSENGKK